ncbi:MAG: sulfite exporter TauE/SafE family protein [Gammaproteobacteria bacterium]|nr:sulfite exporter TauE/SafE family protein [Gammaproteobacteria bacterium]
MFRRDSRSRPGPRSGWAGGVVGGLSSMFGPMLIIYLVSLSGFTKNQFVSSISFLYIGAVVPRVLTLMWFGVLDGPLLVASAAATVPVAIGMGLGQVLRRRISEQRFHGLVLVVLLASGGTMIWRAFS